MGNELTELTLADAGAWRAWLTEHHGSNVAGVKRLTAEGRMHPAGSAAVAEARADGRWPD